MSAKTVKIDDPVDTEINRGAAGTGLSKKAVLEKAVMYYVPRVLRGEISIVELPQAAGALVCLGSSASNDDFPRPATPKCERQIAQRGIGLAAAPAGRGSIFDAGTGLASQGIGNLRSGVPVDTRPACIVLLAEDQHRRLQENPGPRGADNAPRGHDQRSLSGANAADREEEQEHGY